MYTLIRTEAATLGLLKTYIDELVPRIDEAKMKGK